jgi:hypothetical protein
MNVSYPPRCTRKLLSNEEWLTEECLDVSSTSDELLVTF